MHLGTIENQGKLGFGTWEKPGNKPGGNLVKKPGISLASLETWEWPSPGRAAPLAPPDGHQRRANVARASALGAGAEEGGGCTQRSEGPAPNENTA